MQVFFKIMWSAPPQKTAKPTSYTHKIQDTPTVHAIYNTCSPAAHLHIHIRIKQWSGPDPCILSQQIHKVIKKLKL